MPPGSAPTGGFVKNNFIIDTPKLQTLRLKYTSTLITLIFWIIWFYLWVPLITLAGWWFQLKFFQQEMLVVDGLDAFLDVLPVFIAITLALNSTLAIWALYNFIRFKGMDRRKGLPPVQNNDLLQLWAISEASLTDVQNNKVSTIIISEDGSIAVNKENKEKNAP